MDWESYLHENDSSADNGSTSATIWTIDFQRIIQNQTESSRNIVSAHSLEYILGAKRKDISSVAILTTVYCVIFLTGVVGNVSTCIVITRNAYMHTATNFYLLSLAVSDVLTLILALPPELYCIWEAYPWRFGEPFCIFKSFVSEMTSYASILTITAFTIERYIAICHPVKGRVISTLSRAIKMNLFIWVVSCACALPYPIHTRLFYYVHDSVTGLPIKDSYLCNIPFKYKQMMIYVFQVSSFVFFLLPMTIITVMYIMIGVKLRKTEMTSTLQECAQMAKPATTRARKAVLRMLVAVVLAFFICWAPFHAQRLMTLYIQKHQWTEELMTVQSHLFYVSGVLYFISSTVNPILYNLLSRKFRQAFKRTLCRCCVDLDAFPTFYKLKAKFNKNNGASSSLSGARFLNPENQIKMATLCHPDQRRGDASPRLVYQSTKDSLVKPSTKATPCSVSGSSTGTHAHSDGRLHYVCRHKYCPSRKQNPCNGCVVISRSFNNISNIGDTGTRRTSQRNGGKYLMLSSFDKNSSIVNESKREISIL